VALSTDQVTCEYSITEWVTYYICDI